MKHLNDIVLDNAVWERRERNRAIAQSKRDALKAQRETERVPWKALRQLWGDDTTDPEILHWWNSADGDSRAYVLSLESATN